MEWKKQGLVFAGSVGTPFANCCFPAIARLPDGAWSVSWRAGSQKDSADGILMLSCSTNGGSTWSRAEPIPLGPFEDPKHEGHYAPLTVLKDGRLLATIMCVERSDPQLPFFHPDTEGLLPLRTLFCESRDGGRTWNNYREMDLAPYHSPMPITGPVLQLPSGELACQFEVNKSYHDTGPWRHAAAWKISRDGGCTWPECIEIANDPSGRYMFWDARYAFGSGGSCVATFWTFDRAEGRDANIHISYSNDNGRHWTKPRDTGLHGQVCHPVILEDGRLVLAYVDRFETRSIRALVSSDMGQTFDDEITVYKHVPKNEGRSSTTAGYLQDMNAWSFGRVDALADPNGDVAIVFYAGTAEATNICWDVVSLLPPTVR